MHTAAVRNVNERELGLLSGRDNDWSIVRSRRRQKFLLVFGVKHSTSSVEFKIACGDIGLNWLVSRASIRKLGNHVRISISNKFVRFFTSEYVSKLFRLMRVSYG